MRIKRVSRTALVAGVAVGLALAAYSAQSTQAADRLTPTMSEKWRNQDPADDPVDRYVISNGPRSLTTPASYARRDRVRAGKASVAAESPDAGGQPMWSAVTAWPWFWHTVAGCAAALVAGGLAWRWRVRHSDVPNLAVLTMTAAPARRAARPVAAAPEKRRAA